MATKSVLAGTAAFAAVLLATSSASALSPGITVKPRNADVQSKCTFVVNSYNASTLTATVKITSWAAPATFAGYGTNIATTIACGVSDEHGSLLTSYVVSKNSNSVGVTGVTRTIPYSPTYTLCGQASVTKKGGGSSATPIVCLTG
jgi:hypothetical protein